MSHFYGRLRGSARTVATRRGTKTSGVHTEAASYSGAIAVDIWYDEEGNYDKFCVRQMQWHGEGVSEVIAEGVLGQRVTEK